MKKDINIMKERSSDGRKIKVILHLLAWSILMGLPLFFTKRWQVGKDFIWMYYVNTLISGLIFYSNYIFLVPKYFFESSRQKYYLSVLVLVISFYFVSDVSNDLVLKYIPGREGTVSTEQPRDRGGKPGPPPIGKIRPPFRPMHLYSYTINSIFVVFFSLGLKVLERQSRIEKVQKELEKEKLNSELAFLKNQISPHFFFNTLNNIYSLISINPDDSQKAVLKLSKLMRYMLYESEHGNTHLKNEIDFMTNYIDLMKLRVSDKINLSVSFPEKYNDINIPPLLFIPFIENAFKHGISYRDKSFIDISMNVTDKSLNFRCSNSLAKANTAANNDHSGIGLENVKKRLNLLFPGKHDLQITNEENVYSVSLVINFT